MPFPWIFIYKHYVQKNEDKFLRVNSYYLYNVYTRENFRGSHPGQLNSEGVNSTGVKFDRHPWGIVLKNL